MHKTESNVKVKSRPAMIYGLIGLILARLSSPLTSFVIIILIARIWGQVHLGEYVTIWAWLTLFIYVALFGLGEYTSKEIGSRPEKGSMYLTHGLLFVLITSFICAVTMTGGAILLGYPSAVRQGIMITALALPFSSFIVVCQAVFIAYQKIKYIALASLIENILYLAAASVIIFNDYGLIPLIWCLLGVKAAASLVNILIVHKYVTPLELRVDMKFLKKLLAPVAVFGIIGIAGQIYMRIDVIMLSKMTDMVSVSLYSSASKLTEICIILPITFYVMNLPVAASGYRNSRETVHGEIEARAKQLFVLGTLIFGFVYFFSEPILVLIYGRQFAGAEWMLKILMLAFFVGSAEIVLAMSCQAAGYHRASMHISVSRAVANIVLNFILIPIYGGMGAAFATLFAIIFSFVLYHYFLRQSVGSINWIRVIKQPLLVCAAVTLLLYPLAGKLNMFFLGFIFLSGYGLILLAINGFSIGRVLRVDS
jgi:O-antigen/teichoic acid export membrane protein